MGKRKTKKFPQSITKTDRFYYPVNPHKNRNYPTNYVTDMFALNDMASDADVLGSYTGFPTDGREQPIQDADDLW